MKYALRDKKEMKASGVEWIGKIPSDWRVVPLKSAFIQKKEVLGVLAQEKTLLRLSKTGVFPKKKGDGGKNPANYESYQLFNIDDLVFCAFDYDVTPRTIGHVKEEGVMTGAYTRLVSKEGFNSRYYYYYFLYLDETKELLHLCTGLRNGLSRSVFTNLSIPSLQCDVQKRIADFLDEKTTVIDQVVKKKKKQIELLKEKRAALIAHAVTKGLDSNVEMKDSGVEWIGEIPENWSTERLKNIVQLNRSALGQDTSPDHEIDYIDIGNVKSDGSIGTIEQSSFEKAPSRARRIVGAGTVIFATVRPYLKAVARIPDELSHVIVSTGFATMDPAKKLDSKYLYYTCASNGFVDEATSLAVGISYPAINSSVFGTISLPIPNREEQGYIADFLDKKSAEIDQVIKKIQKSIKLTQEYRSSLISHAVTGKIVIL
jgi:type I restriction enzyme, S subunit